PIGSAPRSASRRLPPRAQRAEMERPRRRGESSGPPSLAHRDPGPRQSRVAPDRPAAGLPSVNAPPPPRIGVSGSGGGGYTARPMRPSLAALLVLAVGCAHSPPAPAPSASAPENASPAPRDRAWIERSNQNAQVLLAIQAQFQPEAAARNGVNGL